LLTSYFLLLTSLWKEHMEPLPFYIVDVFAEGKYAGNQLAVVTQGQGLSGQQMQQITREFNFSETTFITSGRKADGGYDVRIFTPGEEVPFAGHPTVGTAWVIRNLLAPDRPETVRLNLKVGQIPVAFDGDGGITWMTTKEPAFGDTLSPALVAEVLGLSPEDVDARFPIQVVSTGLPALMVPLKTLRAVQGIRPRADRLQDLATTCEAGKTILVFTNQTLASDHQLHVRVFAPLVGVPEDPATGSANSCLAGYLVRHRYFGTDSIDIRVEQGYEMGRPSRLYLKARPDGGKIVVQVGGKVQTVAKGKLI
jgi:trans-2,3-dihydro-3-hydroxyanthranilate isomerase